MAREQSHESLTWPPQVKAQDHLVVSALWSHMQQLLSGPAEEAATYIRQLTQMLPPLASVPARDLAPIARIHLQSAAHLKTTLRLLVPEAFDGSNKDATSIASFADRLPPSAEPLVVRLLDLQIFHLCRAQDVTAHMRMHARLRPGAQSESELAAAVAAVAAAMGAAESDISMRAAAHTASAFSNPAGQLQQQQQQQQQAREQQQADQQARSSSYTGRGMTSQPL